ncbi:ATP-binding protein [Aliiroseovarius sediminis]|uniref:sensor histidine kinase n=1 Tax=Aliiroseovarius sediminis TaxID=2925839 RepID=UPI001F58B355|nr:ATP-binding protein [Aliiroseovarius sediminis]MCI2394926.1 ATP-binding protein [Aliiroseovarius sediminis]
MILRDSLARRLSRLIILGFAAIWLLALIASAVVLRNEQQKLADKIIQETAQVYLPAIVIDYQRARAGGDAPPITFKPRLRFDPQGGLEPDAEALAYRLLDRSGKVLMVSDVPHDVAFPPPGARGYSMTESHVFYTTAPDVDGFVMQVGDLRQERSAAFLDSLTALVIPMLAILPLAYLTVTWIGNRALAPLDHLRAEIDARSDARLDPIDAGGQPSELRAITSTINGFMFRLAQALDGERAFATSAAHELRTPVAVALAQVQRMQAETGEGSSGRLATIEDALKRMSRLVTRLLQLARAEAGIGGSQDVHDLIRLTDIVVNDSRRDPVRRDRLHVTLADRPVMATIDPDAFAMIAGNLLDNAFQHASPGSGVQVVLLADGLLCVRNEGSVVPADELAQLSKRFQRGATTADGFGLGLYIADKIARHSGGRLELLSPPAGASSGFEARFYAPLAG